MADPRPLDTEAIHRITVKIADVIQNEIETSGGTLGFLEMKIAIVQAMECLYRYQNQVTLIEVEEDQERKDRGPPMAA